MDDRRKKGEFVGALGALLVHVAVIALLILVSFTVCGNAAGTALGTGSADTDRRRNGSAETENGT